MFIQYIFFLDQVPETEVASAVVLAKLVPFEVQPGLNPIF